MYLPTFAFVLECKTLVAKLAVSAVGRAVYGTRSKTRHWNFHVPNVVASIRRLRRMGDQDMS